MVEQIKWSIVICTIIKLLLLYRIKVVSMMSRCQTFKTVLVVVTIRSCEVGFRGWRTLVLRGRGSRFLEEGFSCIALCTDRRLSLTCVWSVVDRILTTTHTDRCLTWAVIVDGFSVGCRGIKLRGWRRPCMTIVLSVLLYKS